MRHIIIAIVLAVSIHNLAVQAASKHTKRVKYIQYRLSLIEDMSYSFENQYQAEAVRSYIDAINTAIKTGELVKTEYDNDDIVIHVDRGDR